MSVNEPKESQGTEAGSSRKPFWLRYFWPLVIAVLLIHYVRNDFKPLVDIPWPWSKPTITRESLLHIAHHLNGVDREKRLANAIRIEGELRSFWGEDWTRTALEDRDAFARAFVEQAVATAVAEGQEGKRGPALRLFVSETMPAYTLVVIRTGLQMEEKEVLINSVKTAYVEAVMDWDPKRE